MKSNGVAVSLFVFLTFGLAFPGLLGCHPQGPIAAHHHSQETAAMGLASPHGHIDTHAATDHACGEECCASGCPILTGADGIAAAFVYFESGRVISPPDRRPDGVTSLTIDRPPRA